MLDAIKKRIDSVKKQQTDIDDTKASAKDQLTQIEHKQTKIREQIAKIKAEKLAAKEKYYTKMIDYEVEQKLIRDIMWLEKTKQAFLERAERQAKYKAEQAERQAQRRKIQEEREKRQKQWEEQEARRKEEAALRQREWEKAQLKKVEMHPYTQDIDLAESLIYYCAKTARANQKDDDAAREQDDSKASEAEKKIRDFESKGKM